MTLSDKIKEIVEDYNRYFGTFPEHREICQRLKTDLNELVKGEIKELRKIWRDGSSGPPNS